MFVSPRHLSGNYRSRKTRSRQTRGFGGLDPRRPVSQRLARNSRDLRRVVHIVLLLFVSGVWAAGGLGAVEMGVSRLPRS
jgi:hypothetical protein